MRKVENPSLGHEFDATLFAPCGMNCGTCLAYLRERNRCGGCRSMQMSTLKHVAICSILNCTLLAKTDTRFCYDCEKYPCKRLLQLDKRYRTKYRVSLMENLQSIKNYGPDAFRQSEEVKWQCPSCGGTICIHRGHCLQCRK